MRYALTTGPKHNFVGFHDICPWSEDENFFAYHSTNLFDKMPTGEDSASILVKNLLTNEEKEIAKTRAWNFHQGARLQWVPGSSNKLVFNDITEEGVMKSVIFNLEDGSRKELSLPIYAIHPSGKFGIGVNFERLKRYGGYGYEGRFPISDCNKSLPSDDGLFGVDLETGESRLLLSIKKVSYFENFPGQDEKHFLTHIAFNKTGSRICFVHKWKMRDGGFWNRFISSSFDGTDLFLLPGHISHFNWIDDEKIIGFGRNRTNLMKMRKSGILTFPLFKPILWISRKIKGKARQKIIGDRYMVFVDKTKKTTSVGESFLTEDGHPSVSVDGKWMITDTYPDESHNRKLLLYDLKNNLGKIIGEYYSIPDGIRDTSWELSEMRCDLHPRWNRSGKKVCFDSVHEGTRQVYIHDLSTII